MSKHWRNSFISVTIVALLFGMAGFFMPSDVCASDDELVMVSLGDSYSSGEGMPPFYGTRDDATGGERTKAFDWLAHRSKAAWPGRLKFSEDGKPMAEMKDEQWYFVAASGAETKDFWNRQKKEYRDANNKSQVKYLPAQKEVFKEIKNKGQNVDYVTITIGGNDMGFSSIIITAAVHPTYLTRWAHETTLEKNLDDALNLFKTKGMKKIKKVYQQIARETESKAHIIVAGYPPLINQTGTTHYIPTAALVPLKVRMFDPDEAEMINEKVEEFNFGLDSIVVDCRDNEGMSISFVSVTEKVDGKDGFEGHEAYTKQPYINPVILLTQKEDLKEGISSKYSIHPNDVGAQVYADRVQAEVYNHEPKGENRSIKNKVAGTWYWAGPGATPPIKLKKDGSLEVEEVIGEWEEKGTWKSEGSIVHITRDGSEETLKYDAQRDILYYEGSLESCYKRMDTSGGLKHFETVNEIGHPFSDIEAKYSIEETDSTTDEWYLYACPSNSFEFSFESTNTELYDNGLGDSWEIPAPPNPSDKCIRMSGNARELLGVQESVSAKQFQSINDKYLTAAMKEGSGLDLETGTYAGLTGTAKLQDGKKYHILLKDIESEDDITPETMVYIQAY